MFAFKTNRIVDPIFLFKVKFEDVFQFELKAIDLNMTKFGFFAQDLMNEG